MAPLHIILRNFPLVLFPFLRKEVRRVLLLQERVPFVFLVGEDALDGTLVPGVLPRGAFDAEPRQLFADGIRAQSLQEKLVDQLHRFRLLRVHSQAAVLPFLISEESAVGKAALAVRELLPLAPCGVLRNAPRFLLRKGAHDGDEQLPFGVQRVDVLLFKIDLNALLLQLPYRGKGIHRVPRKPADRFRDDEVNLPRQRVRDHLFKSVALFRVRCGDAFVSSCQARTKNIL